MEEECGAAAALECPSLVCEEEEDLETKEEHEEAAPLRLETGSEPKEPGENDEEETRRSDGSVCEVFAEVECENKSPHGEHGTADTSVPSVHEKESEPRRGRKRRSKTQNDRPKSKKASNEDDTVRTGRTGGTARAENAVETTIRRDSTDASVHAGTSGFYRASAPMPLLFSSQTPVPIQPAPPKPTGATRPHSPFLHRNPNEMEVSQAFSTRRSIRSGAKGRARTLNFPLMPAPENPENSDRCLLPPAPKKKTRTLYSTEQLENLEAQFVEDHYPDAEKRKAIAASVGVTPQRIMVWFQNRRAKWRKVERSVSAKMEQHQGRPGAWSSPPHGPGPGALPALPLNKPFSGHFATKPSQVGPSAPAFPAHLYSCPSASPGQPRVRDGDQQQLSSQGGFAEYHPRPLHSPPPIRRASLPLFTAAYSSTGLSSLAHTPPLFLDALEAGSSLSHHDTQPDTSSLFDFGDKCDFLSSAQQNNVLYQLQTSYASAQSQASLSRVSYLTPSPYLTPNPPESTPASYLTIGPGGGSSVVTYSTGGHAFFQSQSTGHVLLQSTGHHSGIAAYPSYPWGTVYSQPSVHPRPQCPPTYPGSLGAPRDHQLPPSGSLPPPVFFSRGDHGPSHPSGGGGGPVLPPVSTLRPSRLRAESTPNRATPLLPPQVSPASPCGPAVPPCVKIEYDSPRQIHSHFHCDFSPIHF